MISELFENPVFKEFLKEIEALGFSVADVPRPGSQPYAVIGGRSNARWWLVPLSNRHVATSGLALFQPILPSAKILKNTVKVLNAIGLSSLWARNRVYVTCPPVFLDLFHNTDLSYAFFTGTDSPHRKTAIQIMDSDGAIKGFAKLSRHEDVKKLINHESDSLKYAQSLQLKSIHIPKVLLNSDVSGARVLVTDTEKTSCSKSPIAFTEYHKNFLVELSASSKSGEQLHSSQFLQKIKQQAEQLAHCLAEEWYSRLDIAIQKITKSAIAMNVEMVSCHGDFTPWNTFMVGEKLYVFDWEYAQQRYPPGYDLIHFYLALPSTKGQPDKETIIQLRNLLREDELATDDADADILLLCYLCGHSLRYIARESEIEGKVSEWDGMLELRLLIDATMSRDI